MPEGFIRKARLLDVQAVHRLISDAAKRAPVIARSQAEIYENLRDFFVYDEGSGPVACCALHITWHDLAEVKSLSVQEDFQGRGIARMLVAACLQEARSLEIARVFALTAVTELFLKAGFKRIEKEQLPHKIWGECVRCPKFPNCDEEAVLFLTGERLETEAPLPRMP